MCGTLKSWSMISSICGWWVSKCVMVRKRGGGGGCYVVEGVLLVADGVQQHAERPHILFFALVRFSLQDFWGGIVCFESARDP
jgi:hypothetical protein